MTPAISKYFQLATLLLLCFNTSAQFQLTLLEKGDSSIYLIGVDDTLAYISFTDPDNINQTLAWGADNHSAPNNQPLRSYLAVSYRIDKNELILREIFGKRYVNSTVEYANFGQYQKDKLVVLFEGKKAHDHIFLNTFDSLFIQIGDSNYLADLNTSIYRIELPRPEKEHFSIRIHENQENIDFKTPIQLEQNASGIFIRFDLLESCLHSYIPQEYLKQNIPHKVSLSNKKHNVKLEFINWNHYWETGKISYN